MREPATETTFEEECTPRNISPGIRPRRELARRVSGGIEITLYWSAHDNSTSIEVWQPASEETLHFNVAREAALDAFYHPFAHLQYEEQNSASALRRQPGLLPVRTTGRTMTRCVPPVSSGGGVVYLPRARRRPEGRRSW